MKKIYIVLSYTGTILSHIINLKTKTEYAHVSISLDKHLEEMYSFGRINPYIAFLGGFVKEGKEIGTFKRFKNTTVKVLELEITNNQYHRIKKQIKYMEENKKLYKFNIKGLLLAGLHIEYSKKNSLYCAQFVKYILKKGNIDIENLDNVITPEEFKKLNNAKKIYKGYLKNYNF